MACARGNQPTTPVVLSTGLLVREFSPKMGKNLQVIQNTRGYGGSRSTRLVLDTVGFGNGGQPMLCNAGPLGPLLAYETQGFRSPVDQNNRKPYALVASG